MPKHALAPTQEKPAGPNPGIGGPPGLSMPAPLLLSNEVLLRSKIAQLQLEQTEQQRKVKARQRSVVTSASAIPADLATAAATEGASSSPSPAPNAARRNRGGGSRSARKSRGAASKHRLANVADAGPRCQPGTGLARGMCAATASSGAGIGGWGAGLSGNPAAAAAAARAARQPATEEEVMERFEAQVGLAYTREITEDTSVAEDFSFDDDENRRKKQLRWLGLTPEGIQALRVMYREQVHTARSMNKRADVLTRKTKEIEKSNEVMWAEAEACTREAVRLEQAAAKLHALSVELDGRRTAMLQAREIEADREATRREEMNASLNAVVGDISKKIKEQEEERLAQDAENSSLRSDLQALLQEYDDNKNDSEKTLRAHEAESRKMTKNLERLIEESAQALEREKGLREAIGKVTAGEEKLRQRVGEHASRLQHQESGLKMYLESVQRLQTEETKLLVYIARLSKEKTDLLSRAGCLVVGRDAACDGGVGEGKTVGVGEGDDGKARGVEDLAEDDLRELLRQKEEIAAEMEREKDSLQARCRELQAERKRVMTEAAPLAEPAPKEQEEAKSRPANGPSESCPLPS